MTGDKTDKTATTTQGLNEWGIPDWRDAAAYGDVDKWPLNRWRWEFLRRREDYRADFDKFAQPTYELELKRRLHMKDPQKYGKYTPEEVAYLKAKSKTLPPPLKPDQPGFCAMDVNDKDFALYRKYGLHGLLNPRTCPQPDSLLCRFEEPELPYRVGRGAAKLHEDPIDSMPVWEGQMAILFSLDRPFNAQIEEAKEMLQRTQKGRHGKSVQRRKHIEKWLGYLRTLDAKAAGASWVEMAALHPHTAQNDTTVENVLNQANALCFNF